MEGPIKRSLTQKIERKWEKWRKTVVFLIEDTDKKEQRMCGFGDIKKDADKKEHQLLKKRSSDVAYLI